MCVHYNWYIWIIKFLLLWLLMLYSFINYFIYSSSIYYLPFWMALLECIAFFAHEGFNKKCKVVYALKITAHIVQESIYKKYIPTFDHTNDKECFTISILWKIETIFQTIVLRSEFNIFINIEYDMQYLTWIYYLQRTVMKYKYFG